MELAGRALGATELKPFQDFGWASGLANLIGALGELYAHGRDPIPAGSVDKNALIEGRMDEDYKAVLKGLIEDGLEKITHLEKAELPKHLRPALLTGWDTKRVLTRALAQPETVLQPQAVPLPIRRSIKMFWAMSGFGTFRV